MKISELVRQNIPAILRYCESNPEELDKLQDAAFSKSTFDINYPFCKAAAAIGVQETGRYWAETYVVRGRAMRVTSQWYNPPTSRSLALFQSYLQSRLGAATAVDGSPSTVEEVFLKPERASRGRYKGSPIGNAQNHLVRNILSRLGEETFGQSHWETVLASFDHSCAYCGSKVDIAMDHVIPTNKQSLGEHRLGNLVPACRPCNARKADRSLDEFLAHDAARLEAIRSHAIRHNYVPIADQHRLRQIIEMAHEDLRHMADRYVALINAVIAGNTPETFEQQTSDA